MTSDNSTKQTRRAPWIWGGLITLGCIAVGFLMLRPQNSQAADPAEGEINANRISVVVSRPVRRTTR